MYLSSALPFHWHNTSTRFFKYEKTMSFIVSKIKTTCKKYQKIFRNHCFYIIHYDEIEVIFEIKKCLCVAKAQITFIRACVNRYSWWNESYASRFTQLSIEA